MEFKKKTTKRISPKVKKIMGPDFNSPDFVGDEFETFSRLGPLPADFLDRPGELTIDIRFWREELIALRMIRNGSDYVRAMKLFLRDMRP